MTYTESLRQAAFILASKKNTNVYQVILAMNKAREEAGIKERVNFSCFTMKKVEQVHEFCMTLGIRVSEMTEEADHLHETYKS